MNIKIQDAGVWVKASEELPDDRYTVFIWVERTNRNIGHYVPEEKIWYWYEDAHIIGQRDLREGTLIEWLKPIKGYVLTEDELESLRMQEYNRGYEEGVYQGKIPF